MNKQRRNKLDKAISYIEEAKCVIQNVKSEEEFAYDNLPENLQYSNRGCQMEENIDNMDEIIDNIEEILSSINDVML